MRNLNVLITSGGTRSKIDDVRHIGNFSNGSTGAGIAEEFLRNNHNVTFFHSHGSKRPYRRFLEIDPDIDYKSEIERIEKYLGQYKSYHDRLNESIFTTFDSYYTLLNDLLTRGQNGLAYDIVILAAAVSDYGVEKFEGKISSDREDMIFKLKRLPKVISKVKEWKPDIYQVGFKLLIDVSDEELIETAYKHGQKNNSDLTVANSLNKKGKYRVMPTYLVAPNREVIKTSREELAHDLYKKIMEDKKHE